MRLRSLLSRKVMHHSQKRISTLCNDSSESFSGLEFAYYSRYFGKRLNFAYVFCTHYPAYESLDTYSCASRWLQPVLPCQPEKKRIVFLRDSVSLHLGEDFLVLPFSLGP